MAEENCKDRVVIGKIITVLKNHLIINTLEYGTINIEREKNWAGGVYWEGFTKCLRPGDNVDVLCEKSRYGFYALGSLLNSPARASKEVVAQNNKIMDFINQPKQEAIVIDYWYFDDNNHSFAKKCHYGCAQATHIKCWGTVWKEVEFNTHSHIPLRYNDVIIIEKLLSGIKPFDYQVVENKTLREERQKIVDNVLLRDFNNIERQKLLQYKENQK